MKSFMLVLVCQKSTVFGPWSFGSEDQHITLENGIVDTLKAIWKSQASLAALSESQELFDRLKQNKLKLD